MYNVLTFGKKCLEQHLLHHHWCTLGNNSVCFTLLCRGDGVNIIVINLCYNFTWPMHNGYTYFIYIKNL